ncbi:MAG: SDR family NAD(P)-dependent oxidoreductase, partial [Mycobacterium sp.]
GFGEQAGFPDAEAEKLMPKPLWVSASEVARAGVEGLLAGKAVIVPGRLNRVAAAVNYLTPRRLLLPLLARGIPSLKT